MGPDLCPYIWPKLHESPASYSAKLEWECLYPSMSNPEITTGLQFIPFKPVLGAEGFSNAHNTSINEINYELKGYSVKHGKGTHFLTIL